MMLARRSITFYQNLIIPCNQNSLCCRRAQSRGNSSLSAPVFQAAVTSSTSKYQIYLSQLHDPFVNLSIEHFLLQKSAPDSTILFLYINRPCVVIGRNQNPWLETNLRMLRSTLAHGREPHQNATENVALVRRRSGGGTVFHDFGNLNYCVICPPADFTRDKHAQMVTQAIRTLTPRARVNERHDIVLDQGDLKNGEDKTSISDWDQTPYHQSGTNLVALKVSGSAYKLTRQRALHHGTCLVSSPNIGNISAYLKSPARSFMKARGVESVRSPIGNIAERAVLDVEASLKIFQTRITQAFAELYQINQKLLNSFFDPVLPTSVSSCNDCVGGYLGDEVSEISDIKSGIDELQSSQWIYGQTPQFVLSSHTCEEDDRERPPLPDDFPATGKVHLVVKSGTITSTRITFSSSDEIASAQADEFDQVLKGKKIQDIQRFEEILRTADLPDNGREISALSAWLDDIFGKTVV